MYCYNFTAIIFYFVQACGCQVYIIPVSVILHLCACTCLVLVGSMLFKRKPKAPSFQVRFGWNLIGWFFDWRMRISYMTSYFQDGGHDSSCLTAASASCPLAHGARVSPLARYDCALQFLTHSTFILINTLCASIVWICWIQFSLS